MFFPARCFQTSSFNCFLLTQENKFYIHTEQKVKHGFCVGDENATKFELNGNNNSQNLYTLNFFANAILICYYSSHMPELCNISSYYFFAVYSNAKLWKYSRRQERNKIMSMRWAQNCRQNYIHSLQQGRKYLSDLSTTAGTLAVAWLCADHPRLLNA